MTILFTGNEVWVPHSSRFWLEWDTTALDAPFSFRHWNRHCLARAAFGDPDRVPRGLDCGWRLESFLDYRDAGLIAIDRNNGNLAAAILRNQELAIGCAHAIRSLHRLIHPDIDRLSRLAGSVHRNSVEIVREHIVAFP